MRRHFHIIGIDESGRGPLAGPVFVGAVCIEKQEMRRLRRRFRGIKDPKQMTPKKREEWFKILKQAEGEGILKIAVASSSNFVIDKHGIIPAVRFALARAMRRLEAPHQTSRVLLDGGLKAGKKFTNQQTIIKGDTKELAIMLAALVAKVTRDRVMLRLHKRYPEYAFHRHKGYGTKLHYILIKKHGPCPIHRKSFLR